MKTCSTPLIFLMCVLIWGTTWLAITFQIAATSPEAGVIHRFLLAALVLFAWCKARGIGLRFGLRQHAVLAAQGTLMLGISYVFVYYAETRVVSGLVAVGFSASPLVNMLGARLAFRTAMSWRIGLGALLGMAGIATIFSTQLAELRASQDAVVGIAFIVLAVLTSGAGSLVASRNHRIGLPVLPALAWGTLYGAGAAALVALMQGRSLALPSSASYLLALCYLAVFGSVVAFSGYLVLLQRIGAARTGYIGVMVPIVALIVSAAFEGYPWTGMTWAGVALSLAGNLLVLRR